MEALINTSNNCCMTGPHAVTGARLAPCVAGYRCAAAVQQLRLPYAAGLLELMCDVFPYLTLLGTGQELEGLSGFTVGPKHQYVG